jgi:hypothetical protein
MESRRPQQRPSRAAIERDVQRLQDKGIVELDAPLRDVIPALARAMVRYRQAEDWWIVASGDNPHAVCECSWGKHAPE